MATLKQVRDAMHRQPFRPFALQMADGRSYIVKHPDFIAVPQTPRGRELVYYAETPDVADPEMHLIDLALVLEVISPAPGESATAQPQTEAKTP